MYCYSQQWNPWHRFIEKNNKAKDTQYKKYKKQETIFKWYREVDNKSQLLFMKLVDDYNKNWEDFKMEKELASKIFILEDYNSKEDMEEDIKKYIKQLKEDYPKSVVTREFYRGRNILVRATEIYNKTTDTKRNNKEKEIDDWYIRQRGER